MIQTAVFKLRNSYSVRHYFGYWRQRLHEALGKPDDNLAIAILSAAAREPQGVPGGVLELLLSEHVHEPEERDIKLRYLIDVLENDGYLVRDGDRLRFRSSLLREFWQRRVVP